MTTSEEAKDLAKKIIEIAGVLKLEVVAEGVEQDAEMDLLKRFGCDYIQGYILAPALPVDQLVSFLGEYHEDHRADSQVVPIRP